MHTIQDLNLCNINYAQPTNIITYFKHWTQFQNFKIKLLLYI